MFRRSFKPGGAVGSETLAWSPEKLALFESKVHSGMLECVRCFVQQCLMGSGQGSLPVVFAGIKSLRRLAELQDLSFFSSRQFIPHNDVLIKGLEALVL